MNTRARELETKIKELAKEFNCDIAYISVIQNDDKTEVVSLCGNFCYVCAKDYLEAFILENDIKHVDALMFKTEEELEAEKIH